LEDSKLNPEENNSIESSPNLMKIIKFLMREIKKKRMLKHLQNFLRKQVIKILQKEK